MGNGSTKVSRPVGRATGIGLVTGVLVGALFGEIWGYLEAMFRWTNTHDYQVVKAIHGSIFALLSHSGTALEVGLLLAVICGAIGLITGSVTGTGMAALGMRLGPGYEWILISMLGVLRGMWAPDGFSLPFYGRMLIVSILTGAAVSWLTVRLNKRLLGERLVTTPYRHWMWVGYILALVVVAAVAFLVMAGFFLITRV